VCVEEHVWRSQANLLLAYCYTQQVLDKLKAECGSGTERQPKWSENGRGGDREFRFDLSGVIMEGVVPVFAPSVAGKGGNKVSP